MFRNLILIALIAIGAFFWLAPTWHYLELTQSLPDQTPRYNMEISLAISYSYTLGTIFLGLWFLPFFNQHTYPVGYAVVFLAACCFWDLSLHFSFFKTFYQGEIAPYSLSLLFFHFTFSIFFAFYLYLNSESNRFNTESKVACYLTGVSAALVFVSGFSEEFVALIYCFATMVGVWFGTQGAFLSKKKTRKSNQIGWILSLPGTLVLAYLLLAPHVSDWAGVRIIAYKNPNFPTKLEILGKTLSPTEKKQKELQQYYENTLQNDRQHYRHSAKFLFAFFFLGLFLKTQKKQMALSTEKDSIEEQPPPNEETPPNETPTETEKNSTEKLPEI